MPAPLAVPVPHRGVQRVVRGKTTLFTDHGEDYADEQIVLGYRAQYQVKRDPCYLKNPVYLCPSPDDTQSAAPATGPGRHRAQHG